MKKKLLLLLLYFTAISMVGQNPTRFPYGVQITGGQTTTSTTNKLISQESNGTLNTIDAANLPISTATQTALDLKANKDSGLSLGGRLTINVDPTKYDLEAGEGYITNSLTGVVEKISWGTQAALTTPYRTTSVATYVLMANAGGGFGTIVTQNTAPTPQQYRTHIYLGKLAHTTFTNILFAVSEPSRMFDLAGQISDVNRTLGARNNTGNVVSANGANLNINCSAGSMYRAGANYANDRNAPSDTSEPIFTAGAFRNKFRNGSGGWTAVNTTVIDPNNYDDGSGILQSVPNNKWTIKVFWRFGGTGTIHCDYGQAYYNNKADAILAIDKAITAEDPENVRDAAKRGWLVVQKGATALNDLNVAEFFKAGKDGERIAGGSSTANLQIAYDNSITPQITTSTGGGALAVKRGSAADTDNVLVVQNGSGSNTFSVTGAGVLNASNKQNSLDTDGTGVKFPTVDAVNNGTVSKLEDSDVIGKFYGQSNESVVRSSGEAFVVKDTINDRYVLYSFNFSGIKNQVHTAKNIEGPYNLANASMVGNNQHKFALLVDENGKPVLVGGLYHGYSVNYPGETGKAIYHCSSSNLVTGWTLGSAVISAGFAGATDAANADSPYAVYKDGTIYLWYMGHPSVSQPTYGLAMRLHLATSTSVGSGFVFNSIVLNPSTTSTDFDYGWIGGAQIKKQSTGYVMLYNAGGVRPTGVADEHAPSLIGTATASTITGTWTKTANNPLFSLTNAESDGSIEVSNIYRPNVYHDKESRSNYLFYNSGAAGTETITFTRQDYGIRRSKKEQYITNTSTAIVGSQVRIPATGTYTFKVTGNILDSLQSNKSVRLKLVKNEIDTIGAIDINIGSVKYDKKSIDFQRVVNYSGAGSISLYVQSTSGATAGLKIANTKMQVSRFRTFLPEWNIYNRNFANLDSINITDRRYIDRFSNYDTIPGLKVFTSDVYMPSYYTGIGHVTNFINTGNETTTGSVTAGSFIKSGTNANLLLKAGGGNSIFYDNGTNIGIGTTSPLDYTIYGYGANIENKGGRGGGFVSTDASGTHSMVFSVDSSGGIGNLKTVTNTPFVFSVNDVEKMRMTNSQITTTVPFLSPDLTGTPTAPTATSGTNTTQIATTAFVQNAVSSGSYTPTFTNVLNVASTTLTNAYYTKIGDIVTVTVGVSITPTTASTNTVLKIDLPFARSVSTTTNIGTSVSGDNTLHLAGNVQTSGDTTTASLYFYPTTTNSYETSVSFQYKLN